MVGFVEHRHKNLSAYYDNMGEKMNLTEFGILIFVLAMSGLGIFLKHRDKQQRYSDEEMKKCSDGRLS